jgi:RNA polymerase sigma-54 factor
MTPSMQQHASHQLTLTPFLQRSIQLLQVSSLEFRQEVQAVLTTNPFLETVESEEAGATDAEPPEPTEAPTEEPEAVESAGLDELWSGAPNDYRSGRTGDDEWDPALRVPSTLTLRDHLLRQAGCLRLSDRDAALVQAVIEAVAAFIRRLAP